MHSPNQRPVRRPADAAPRERPEPRRLEQIIGRYRIEMPEMLDSARGAHGAGR